MSQETDVENKSTPTVMFSSSLSSNDWPVTTSLANRRSTCCLPFTVNGNTVWSQPSALMFPRNKNSAALSDVYGDTDKSADNSKAIVYISFVEECSCVNNHPLLCPAQVCGQGKPRGLFARRKNSLPQERRILVGLLSIFNRMLSITNFLVFYLQLDFSSQ